MIAHAGWLKWLCLAVVMGVAFLVLAYWDPFGVHGRRLDQARKEVALGKLEAEYRQAERQAQQAIVLQQAEQQKKQKAISELTEVAVSEARGVTDAKVVLGDDRIRRLREHDLGLCGQGARLGGCAAATASAR